MDAETVTAPALGYSILANLGDEKQLTVQCYVDSEEDLPSIHGKLDKAMAVVDRQKAKYRKRDLLKEVADMEGALGRLHDDLNRLEGEHQKNLEALTNQIASNNEAIETVNRTAYDKGRTEPVGADASRIRALKRDNELVDAQMKKAAAEREQGRQNLAVNIGRFEDSIAKHREQIAECDALIGT